MDTNLPGRAGAAPSPHRRLPFDEVVEGQTIFKGEQIWNRAARANPAPARPSGIGPQSRPPYLRQFAPKTFPLLPIYPDR
jgi:hypothetical protein